MTEEKREELEKKGCGIEVYHQQCCGVEPGASAQSRLHSVSFALRAFLLLEAYRLQTGVSLYEAKAAILREAIRRYLAHPRYVLQPTA